MKKLISIALGVSLLGLAGCATEGSRVVESQKVNTYDTPYHGQKSLIAVGKFANKSSYMNGIFQDGEDRLGNQSKSILMTHLQQTGRFRVLDRSNMDETAQEAKIRGQAQNMKGATYIITGDVTGFGRKDVGDKQLFGLLGRGKKQVAYAKVMLNVVNVNTTEVAFSAEGAGEYDLSSREVLGFGGTSGYDATLNGKAETGATSDSGNHATPPNQQGAAPVIPYTPPATVGSQETSPLCAPILAKAQPLTAGTAVGEMPATPRPATGVATEDPTWHSCVVRLTNHAETQPAHPVFTPHAAQQAFNADDSAVLLKGGHLGANEAVHDLLFTASGQPPLLISHPRVATRNLHGAGCTLSSAIAAFLAQGQPLAEAVQAGCDFVHQAIAAGAAVRTGHGNGPLNHGAAPLPMRTLAL